MAMPPRCSLPWLPTPAARHGAAPTTHSLSTAVLDGPSPVAQEPVCLLVSLFRFCCSRWLGLGGVCDGGGLAMRCTNDTAPLAGMPTAARTAQGRARAAVLHHDAMHRGPRKGGLHPSSTCALHAHVQLTGWVVLYQLVHLVTHSRMRAPSCSHAASGLHAASSASTWQSLGTCFKMVLASPGRHEKEGRAHQATAQAAEASGQAVHQKSSTQLQRGLTAYASA